MTNIKIIQGDITKMKADAIVNAANNSLLGGGGVDGAIHAAAGPHLLEECMTLHGCHTGDAKITLGYDLPAKHVIHTVGPIIHTARVSEKEKDLLASCYRSCLAIADEKGLTSIAFCCISTGEFHFPNELAAEVATSAVRKYLQETGSQLKVVFNVFKDEDRRIYERLLGKHTEA